MLAHWTWYGFASMSARWVGSPCLTAEFFVLVCWVWPILRGVRSRRKTLRALGCIQHVDVLSCRGLDPARSTLEAHRKPQVQSSAESKPVDCPVSAACNKTGCTRAVLLSPCARGAWGFVLCAVPWEAWGAQEQCCSNKSRAALPTCAWCLGLCYKWWLGKSRCDLLLELPSHSEPAAVSLELRPLPVHLMHMFLHNCVPHLAYYWPQHYHVCRIIIIDQLLHHGVFAVWRQAFVQIYLSTLVLWYGAGKGCKAVLQGL